MVRVANSYELNRALSASGPNPEKHIILGRGIYDADAARPFTIVGRHDIVIQGELSENGDFLATIRGNIMIQGTNCQLLNCIVSPSLTSNALEGDGIIILGSGNVIENIQISNFHKCIRVTGNSNRIGNTVVINAKCGIDIHGNDNELRNIKMTNTEMFNNRITYSEGINMTGRNNRAEILNLTNICRGIIVGGDANIVMSCHFLINVMPPVAVATGKEDEDLVPRLEKDFSFIGVRIGRGIGNVVDSLTSHGIFKEEFGENNHDLLITVDAQETTISNCNLINAFIAPTNAN